MAGYGSNTQMQFGTFTLVVLPAVPQASAGDSRSRRSLRPATRSARRSPRLRRCRSTLHPPAQPRVRRVLHAPSITASSVLTFTPPVAMPHTESGQTSLARHPVRDDRARGRLHLQRLDRPLQVDRRRGGSRFRSFPHGAPASIPAAGGTQTVTVSLTPRRPSGFATITIDPASIVPGATVDPSSIVPPAADPTGAADTQLGSGNGSVTWSTLSGPSTAYRSRSR